MPKLDKGERIFAAICFAIIALVSFYQAFIAH